MGALAQAITISNGKAAIHPATARANSCARTTLTRCTAGAGPQWRVPERRQSPCLRRRRRKAQSRRHSHARRRVYAAISIKVAYTWVPLDVPGARPWHWCRWPKPWTSDRCWPPRSSGRDAAAIRDPAAGVLLVWLALVRAIKPLNRLEERIRARPDDLCPLDVEAVPLEVAPLVVSVNDLLMRLKGLHRHPETLLADAAHQLKTPLAALRMQPTG